MGELRQREPSIVVPWLRDLARGKPCMFRIPGFCNGNPETTVWCHSNRERHGKGKGKKAHDPHGAFGCSGCHDWYDNRVFPIPTKEEREDAFDVARERTWEYIFRNSLVRAA